VNLSSYDSTRFRGRGKDSARVARDSTPAGLWYTMSNRGRACSGQRWASAHRFCRCWPAGVWGTSGPTPTVGRSRTTGLLGQPDRGDRRSRPVRRL